MPENTDRQTEKSNSSRDNRVITATRYEPVSAARHSPAVRVRTGAILLLVLLSVAVLAAWFVLTAKSVHILTDPESADIDLSGGFNIKLADRFLVRSGDYQVHASNSGFHSVTESIRVGPEQDQQFDFVLQKLPGHLQVRTAPVEGATIWLDDLLRGRSPVIIESIPPGTHSIRILADRYLPVIDAIDIQGRDLKQVLDVTLKPAWAKVSLSSVPAGANVYVDDQIVGQTPMAAEILHGTHRLRIHLSGYKAWHDQLTTVANEPVIIPQVTLQLADAILLLSSSPAQATVTTNGEYQGQTPVELALPPGKPVVVRLFKEGYQRISRTFSLESGDEKRVRLDLTPELSRVAVITEPAGAQLYVDGKLMGSASQTIELTTREHRIRVSKPGYVDHLATVTPRSGIEQQLRVRLKSARQARLESIQPVIESPGGQTMKLFRAGVSFTMGASRREPGRRANETLRSVELTRPFYLSIKEVSNAAFRRFRSGHSSGLVRSHTLNTPNQPVVQISWSKAALYCNWLSEQDELTPFYTTRGGKVIGFDVGSNGYRLPSEAEWAWAARFEGGGRMLKFAWGDRMPPVPGSGNYADQAASDIVAVSIDNYNDGFATTAPVGQFQANGKGLFDLGGNAAEWIHDFYATGPGGQSEPQIDPLGPPSGEYHIIRGSGWAHGSLSELRLSFRDYGKDKRDDVGFRIARYVE